MSEVDGVAASGGANAVRSSLRAASIALAGTLLPVAPAPLGATALVTLFASSASRAADVSLTEVSRAAPTFSLASLDGATVDNAALAGKPWVINFWATWCPPCIEEMPAMNTAWEALEPAGVGMLAVNVGETPEAIETFLGKVAIDFPILLGDGARTLPDWGAQALPTTLIVDADGQVVLEALGPRDWDDPGLIERLTALADE